MSFIMFIHLHFFRCTLPDLFLTLLLLISVMCFLVIIFFIFLLLLVILLIVIVVVVVLGRFLAFCSSFCSAPLAGTECSCILLLLPSS